MPMTVWYRISHSDYPHCRGDMILVDGLNQADAEKVAKCFTGELRYILGDEVDVQVWAD